MKNELFLYEISHGVIYTITRQIKGKCDCCGKEKLINEIKGSPIFVCSDCLKDILPYATSC